MWSWQTSESLCSYSIGAVGRMNRYVYVGRIRYMYKGWLGITDTAKYKIQVP